MECNSMVYTYNNSSYQLYKIYEAHDEILLCYEQGYFITNFKETPEINWKSVGVFKEGALSEETKVLQKNEIHGLSLIHI